MVDILIDVIRSDVSILMVLVQPRQQQRKYWCWYLVGSWAGHGELFWAGTGNSLVIRQQILFSTNHASHVNIQIYSLPCQHFETFVIFSVWKKSCYLASRDKYFDILAAETLTSVFNILTDPTANLVKLVIGDLFLRAKLFLILTVLIVKFDCIDSKP